MAAPEHLEDRMKELMVRLRNGNPESFDQFIEAAKEYYDDLTFRVVQSSADEVLQAQGRAQSAYAYLRMLKECTVEKKSKPLPAFGPVSAQKGY